MYVANWYPHYRSLSFNSQSEKPLQIAELTWHIDLRNESKKVPNHFMTRTSVGNGDPRQSLKWRTKCAVYLNLNKTNLYREARLESIEWFTEDQAFSTSYELPPPLHRQQDFSLSQSSCVSDRSYWLEMGEGVGELPNHTRARKPGHLYIIQYPLRSTNPFLRHTTGHRFRQQILKIFSGSGPD